jgi:hypothetical protein
VKLARLFLLAAVLVSALAVPVAAQSPSDSPAPSETPAPSAALCVVVSGEAPVGGWTAIALTLALQNGTATLTQVVDPAACAPAPAATPTLEPTAEPTPTVEPTAEPTAAYDDALIVDTIDTGFQRVSDWADELANGGLSGTEVIDSMATMATFAKTQYGLKYDASPCLSHAWTEYKQGMSLLRGKIVGFLRWVVRGSGRLPTSISSGFKRSATLIRQAHDEADTLDCSAFG